jgi:hypothetical protein
LVRGDRPGGVPCAILQLQHDLYLLLYFTVILGALGLYLTKSGLDVGARLRFLWWVSLGIGAVLALFQINNVLDRDSTRIRTGPTSSSRSGGAGLPTDSLTCCC